MYRYVYCITRTLHKPCIDVAGIGNAIVSTLQYKEIMAILSGVSMAKISVSNENVLRHAVVVETVPREQTVLPMRFSSVFNGDDAVLEFLKNRYAVFISDLERLQDKLEMGIRIIARRNITQDNDYENHSEYPQASFMKGGLRVIIQRGLFRLSIGRNGDVEKLLDKKCSVNPGIAYLQQRRAHYTSLDENDERVREIVKICHAQFEDICVEYKRDTHTPFPQGVSLNYLIHKDSVNEFKGRFNDLKCSLNELHFLCSGPWPPYHFVSSGGGDGEHGLI